MAKRKPQGPPADPDAGWNAAPIDWQDAQTQCLRIQDKAAKASSQVWRRCGAFLQDISRKAQEIGVTISTRRCATAGQQKALRSWEDALDRIIEQDK
jgi:hypothetical protein